MFEINIPDRIQYILEALHAKGFEAYVVGGCIRDSLLGIEPKDWDICTSALPDEVEIIMDNVPDSDKNKYEFYHTLNFGIKFGTVIVADSANYARVEITTFRADGIYSDNRKPDSVQFVSNLEDDLSRRDFTVNAMAYNNESGLIDLFGGVKDIRQKTIRCVGNPKDRFREDALRMLRAIRFASRLGFSIDWDTAKAIHDNADLITRISAERIQTELNGILLGKYCLLHLMYYSDLFEYIIPEFKACIGFDQNNKYHAFNVYDHIVHAVSAYDGNDLIVKLALFLHDIGKPLCYTEDERGGHFYGHAEPSAKLAENALRRLKYENRIIETVTLLIRCHDAEIAATSKSIKRWFNKIGKDNYFRLLEMKKADMLAHREGTQDGRIQLVDTIYAMAKDIGAEDSCFSMRQLAINGKDLISLGIPQGQEIGRLLNIALDGVINEEVQNEKCALIGYLILKSSKGE